MMMHDMASMMWGMGLLWLILIVLLFLAVIAQIKYLFLQ